MAWRENEVIKLACGCGATLEYVGLYPDSQVKHFLEVHKNCCPKITPKADK